MIIDGRCHCGDVAFTLDWPESAPEIVARECGCSFCRKHGGVWTSHRDASLLVTLAHPQAVSRYRFGTETAVFYVCGRCGAVPLVVSEIEGHVHAVVNVNTFESLDPSQLRREPARFDAEDRAARLARRQKHWIADVRISSASAG